MDKTKQVLLRERPTKEVLLQLQKRLPRGAQRRVAVKAGVTDTTVSQVKMGARWHALVYHLLEQEAEAYEQHCKKVLLE